MLIDILQERLKNLAPDLATITAYWQNSGLETQFHTLEAESTQELFWQNPQQTEILKELQRIRVQRDQYLHIMSAYQELPELIHLFENDEQELQKLSDEIRLLERNVSSFKIALLLSDPQDSSNCFLNINAGAGGTESQDWAHILLRMYLRFCERHKLSADVIDYQTGEEAGI